MERNDNRRSKNGKKSWGSNWNSSGKDGRNFQRGLKQQFGRSYAPTAQEIFEHESAIQEYKAKEAVCAMCGQPISDMALSMSDKKSGVPVHFDCVLDAISKQEKLKDGEKIIYIGQGRFGVVYFENPHDMKHFAIRKIIEWEERGKVIGWRAEISDLYSKVR